jgi:cell division septation protein DedD
MQDRERITSGQWNILIASSVVTLVMVFLLGLVVGKNMNLPERPQHPKDIARQVNDDGVRTGDLSDIDLIRTKNKQTSKSPHVPDEGLEFYDSAQEETTVPKQDQKSTTTTIDKPFVPPSTPTGNQTDSTPVSDNAEKTNVSDDLFVLADKGFETAYAVQMSSVGNRTYANNSVSELLSMDYPAYISEIQFSTGRIHYRVRIGPYKHRDAAEAIKLKLSRELKVTPLVMTLSSGAL